MEALKFECAVEWSGENGGETVFGTKEWIGGSQFEFPFGPM